MPETMTTETIIKDMIQDNEDNKTASEGHDGYLKGYHEGYYEGYHDALVDLMNKLNIPHNEEIYND